MSRIEGKGGGFHGGRIIVSLPNACFENLFACLDSAFNGLD